MDRFAEKCEGNYIQPNLMMINKDTGERQTLNEIDTIEFSTHSVHKYLEPQVHVSFRHKKNTIIVQFSLLLILDDIPHNEIKCVSSSRQNRLDENKIA